MKLNELSRDEVILLTSVTEVIIRGLKKSKDPKIQSQVKSLIEIQDKLHYLQSLEEVEKVN